MMALTRVTRPESYVGWWQLVLIELVLARNGSPLNEATPFLRTPSPLNVTEGELAKFTCQAYGIAISWFVDDATVTTGNEKFWFITKAGNGIVNSTLYAQASEQTHNSSMECVVYSAAIKPYSSGIVHLLVQGAPGPIATLEAVSDVGVIFLSWTAPPTLDITGRHPDLWYTVTVGTIYSSASLQNVTEPQFNFTAMDTMDCPVFEFSVTPENTAGVGIQSEPVTEYFIQKPKSVAEPNVVEIIVYQQGFTDVHLLFNPNNSCVAQAAQTYQVYILDAIGAVVCVKEVVLQRNTSDQWIAVLFSLQAWDIELLSPNETYYISIESQNQAGRRNSTGMLHLYPSGDWMDTTYTESDNGVCITCPASEGFIEGCSVVLSKRSEDKSEELHISQSQVQSVPGQSTLKCFTDLEGNYTIEVYVYTVYDEASSPGYLYEFHASLTLSDVATNKQPSDDSDETEYLPNKQPSDDSDETEHLPYFLGAAGAAFVLCIGVTTVTCILICKCWFSKGKPCCQAAPEAGAQTTEVVRMRRNQAYTNHTPKIDMKQCLAYESVRRQQQ